MKTCLKKSCKAEMSCSKINVLLFSVFNIKHQIMSLKHQLKHFMIFKNIQFCIMSVVHSFPGAQFDFYKQSHRHFRFQKSFYSSVKSTLIHFETRVQQNRIYFKC